jgi:hypothetical protein
VDGLSDSEDDNEIPLPRFKKKSSWIPKPSKNTTLESFIDLVKHDVQTATSTNIPTHYNLTPAEKGAAEFFRGVRVQFFVKSFIRQLSICLL